MYGISNSLNLNQKNKKTSNSFPITSSKKSYSGKVSQNTKNSPTNYVNEASSKEDTSQSLTSDFRDSITGISLTNTNPKPSVSNIELTTNKLREAIILSEIIGEPKCKRRKRARYGH